MKSLVPLSIAACLAFSVVPVLSYAQTFSDDNVRIVRVDRSDVSNSSGTIIPPISQDMPRLAQEELANNPELRAHLQSRNVSLSNVLAIETAANGSKIVYVK